ncbi:MAG TPA: transglutaminase domain-containing protein, partial [Bryobacteraceae bacterium]|nr:transglutaminase domain-containing protein [Bryobacteraceae bacterium]
GCALAVLALSSARVLPAGAPKARSLALEYAAVVRDIPAGTGRLDFWMPVPHNDLYQQITNLQVESAHRYQISTNSLGNRILHLSLDHPQAGDLPVTLRFNVIRREHRQDLLPAASVAEEGGDVERWLKPDRLVPLDDQIRKWAREVADAAQAKTDLEMARAIYNHVVATVKYDKSGKGWGRGDIYYACENRRGNCTDFHAIFIGYARALGIPARFAIGFPVPPDRGSGQIAGYHCWAEFYAKGIGWVPIDASEAAKDPSRREYFFGAHDENRVEFTRGRDLVLNPPQAGEPLNYFVYPYAEADGKPLGDVQRTVTYRDLPVAISAGSSR